MDVSIILFVDERGGINCYVYIFFENCFDKFFYLDVFGKIVKVKIRLNQINLVSGILSVWMSEENIFEKLGLQLKIRN